MIKNKPQCYSRPSLGILRSQLSRPKRSQFNFTWLFAIIAGVIILILAIYGTTKIIETKRHQTDTETGKSLSILTNPMQAGWAEGRYNKITFRQETKINNLCNDFEFGRNDISVATSSGVGKEWIQAGGATSIHDKYIFSSSEQGKEYYIFSRAFEFPYKVSDLIFLSTKNYCFVNPSTKIQRDIEGMGVQNIEVINCSSNSVEVCFNSECDISVYGDETSGRVVKDDGDYEYVGNLLYGAIFADKEVYDCNVKRLLYRTGKIADVFIDVGRKREARGIGTNLVPHLILFQGLVMNSTSDDLISLQPLAKDIGLINDKEVAGVW